MKIKSLGRLRAKLAEDKPVYGLWVTLESAAITEIAVALGLDWVVVDAEHGDLDWKDINEHVRAALRSPTVVLVRIAERNTVLTKRALDIGADGIVVPQIGSAAEAEQAVRDALYPPEGRRGIGAERATTWGQCIAEHVAEANEHVLVVPMIESVAAVKDVPAICQIAGVDLVLCGPNDYSASAGHPGHWEGPGVAEQILQLKDTIRVSGKHCGVMSTSVANLLERRDQGFRMLGISSDCGLLLRALHEALGAVDCDRLPSASLDPAEGLAVRSPIAQRPA